MKNKIGFFQELLPNGMISSSSGRLIMGVIIAVTLGVVVYCTIDQRLEIKKQREMLTQTIKDIKVVPIRTDSVIQQISERPVLSPAEFRENVKSIPGVPWEGVGSLILFALTYGGYRKNREEKSLDKETPVINNQPQATPAINKDT